MPESPTYLSLEEANDYWEGRDPVWGQATEEARESALVKATEWIDTAFNWVGRVAANDQVLSWPRIGAWDKEGRYRTGIPAEIKNATAWLALQALNAELDPALDRGGDIKSVQAGSVEIEWNEGAPTGKSYRHVKRLLKNLITDGRLRRG